VRHRSTQPDNPDHARSESSNPWLLEMAWLQRCPVGQRRPREFPTPSIADCRTTLPLQAFQSGTAHTRSPKNSAALLFHENRKAKQPFHANPSSENPGREIPLRDGRQRNVTMVEGRQNCRNTLNRNREERKECPSPPQRGQTSRNDDMQPSAQIPFSTHGLLAEIFPHHPNHYTAGKHLRPAS